MNATLPRELAPLDTANRRAIARAISAVENDDPAAAPLLHAIASATTPTGFTDRRT